MLLYLGVLICLAAAAGAQTPCSMPDKWSAVLSDIIDINQGQLRYAEFHYDHTIKKIAMQYKTFGPVTVPPTTPTTLHRVVIDYITNLMHTINADGTCGTPNPIGIGAVDMLPPWITSSSGSVNYGTSYVGSPTGLGSSLSYESRKIPLGDITITMVFNQQCVPVIQGVYGTFAGGPVDRAQVFSGFTPGTSNPAVFDTTCV